MKNNTTTKKFIENYIKTKHVVIIGDYKIHWSIDDKMYTIVKMSTHEVWQDPSAKNIAKVAARMISEED